MNEGKKLLLIGKIENGIVIDHIPAGYGLRILAIFHSYPEMRSVVTTVGLNYASQKLGSKDMIKLQTEQIPERVMQHLAVVCSGVTVKRIRDFRVDHKFVVGLPEVMTGLAKCRNPGCITNHERDAKTRFVCVDSREKRFRCSFCERIFRLDELELIG